MTPLPLALLGWAALAAAMLVVWLRQVRTRDASTVDVVWTFGLGGLGVLYALLAEGWAPRRALVGLLAACWALRLGSHLGRRVARAEEEDPRYAELRREKGAGFDRFAFWFFQVQALQATVQSLAFLLLCVSAAEPMWRWVDVLGLAIGLSGIVGESVADRQLAAWKRDPAQRGRTCRAGLWRYSRHPNYFFEWVHWCAYPVIGIGLPWGGLLWLAPAIMLFLLLRVTGIPPAEARALASRGDDYRRYQAATNAFFPGPPRPEPPTV